MLSFKQFIKENDNNDTFSDDHLSIYPDGRGSDVGDNVPKSETTLIPTKSASGNEPFKDKSFFNSPEKKDYMNKMSSDIKKGKEMPPVISTPNPADPEHNVVLDGNHRMEAHKQAGVPNIPTQHVDHDDIHLASHDYEHPDQTFHKLSSFREPDGSYDMNKPREPLGGKNLGRYFVQPNGSHQFES